MKRLIAALALCVLALPAVAAWQTRVQGSYTYYEDGYSQAFPLGDGKAFFVRQHVGPNQWMFFHPDHVFPNGEVRYVIYYVDGASMWQIYSTTSVWQQLTTCNLGTLKTNQDNAYRNFVQNSNTDHRAYYMALYEEAKAYFTTCAAMSR